MDNVRSIEPHPSVGPVAQSFGWPPTDASTRGIKTLAAARHFPYPTPARRGGRVVEGTPLLRAQTSKASRGFESHPLRQSFEPTTSGSGGASAYLEG